MKVNVKRIPAEGETLEGAEPPSIMGLDEADVSFDQEIAYRFHAQVQNNALLVTGQLQTPVRLRCSRCLERFSQPIKIPSFVFHQELHGEDFVDLTDNIREDIILELPQRALCQTGCQGLCPVCGINRNKSTCQCEPAHGDVRWHALDQIKIK